MSGLASVYMLAYNANFNNVASTHKKQMTELVHFLVVIDRCNRQQCVLLDWNL